MVLLSCCGYQPIYSAGRTERCVVVGSAAQVVDVALLGEVESGLRTGLARAGALRPGTEGYPRVVVEVLRMDAASEGIAALPGGRRETVVGGLPLSSAEARAPLARGTRVGVVARAWLEPRPGADRERDTGDVRASDTMAAEQLAALEALRYDDALRASARRLGERLARMVLGLPEASDDGI